MVAATLHLLNDLDLLIPCCPCCGDRVTDCPCRLVYVGNLKTVCDTHNDWTMVRVWPRKERRERGFGRR